MTTNTAAATLQKSQTPVWVRPAASLAIVSLFAFLWALFVRSVNGVSPISPERIGEFGFDPFLLGIAVLEIVVPIALFYIFSRMALFRRAINDTPEHFDEIKLFAVLAAIQILFTLYEYRIIDRAEGQVTMGLLIVMIAGIVGGWRMGLAIGFLTAVMYSFWAYTSDLDGGLFLFVDYFEYYLVKSVETVGTLWLGVTMGVIAAAWKRYRFHPLIALALGVMAEVAVYSFLLFGNEWVDHFTYRLLPNIAITSLALMIISLIIRHVQNEETQRLAEMARLELTQTNLTLAQTKLALTQAELRALHAQINPHFFFNSLNTIRYFIRTDPENARELLTNLSEIFQRALSAGEFIPLKDEIEHVEAYLALEKARLDERLQIIWTNLAKGLLDYPIPTLILQPLVENAVIHGVSPQTEGGIVHIVLNKVGDELMIQVDDDGDGFDVEAWRAGQNGDRPALSEFQQMTSTTTPATLPSSNRPSIGLSNVDERLRMLYGADHGLIIESEAGVGTRFIVKIPIEGGA